MHASMTRRNFLAGAALGAAALSGALPAMGQTAQQRLKLIAFSKPFQKLDFDQTADLVAEVGWDGIECPVRAKGHVEAQRVEEDLPRMVEAMKKRQKEVLIITTDVREITPLNEKVLRTAAKLGIKKYRLGVTQYARDKSIPDQLKEIQAKYRDVVALNKELGIQGGHQNHSGSGYVGAPVWDVYLLVKDFDPQYMGIHFDIGHATVEGGSSWPIHARLMRPWFGAVYLKDFYWEKTNTGWKSKWCPVGEGMVRKSFFDDLMKSGYSGPISQHHEYFEGSTDRKQMVDYFKKDLGALKAWLGA